MDKHTEATIQHVRDEMTGCALWAQHWMTSALCGTATRRHIMRGDHRLTAEELVDQAMEMAATQIHRHRELQDDLFRLLAAKEDARAT